MATSTYTLLSTVIILLLRSSSGLQCSATCEDNDAGPVGSCELPANNGSTCALDYLIPSSLARIAHILEREIQDTYQATVDIYSAACGVEVRDIHCRLRFPRCSDDRETVIFTLSEANCVDRLASGCPTTATNSFIGSGLCAVNNWTVPIGNCKPLTEYSDYQFQHCPIDPNIQVTEWQYELLKNEDRKINDSVLISLYPLCGPFYRKYLCQYVGRCTNDSEHILIGNTQEDCEDFVDCDNYPDSISGLLTDTYRCCLWPSQNRIITCESTLPTLQTSQTAQSTQALVPLQDTTQSMLPSLDTTPTTSPTLQISQAAQPTQTLVLSQDTTQSMLPSLDATPTIGGNSAIMLHSLPRSILLSTLFGMCLAALYA